MDVVFEGEVRNGGAEVVVKIGGEDVEFFEWGGHGGVGGGEGG